MLRQFRDVDGCPPGLGCNRFNDAENSSLTPADIDNAIENLEMNWDIGDAGRDDLYGYGILDVAKD